MICPFPPIIFPIAAFIEHFISRLHLSPRWKSLLLLPEAEATEVCLFLAWAV